jgi:hypothetical protein
MKRTHKLVETRKDGLTWTMLFSSLADAVRERDALAKAHVGRTYELTEIED